MQKLYGQQLRSESGVTKTFKAQVTEPVKKRLQDSDVNKVLGELNKIGTELKSKVEKLVQDKVLVKSEADSDDKSTKSSIDDLLAETRHAIAETTMRLTSLDQPGGKNLYDIEGYSIQLPVASASAIRGSGMGCVSFSLGERITIYWTAPKNHSAKDWIGLYKVTDNPSKTVTTTSSRGHWRYLKSENEDCGTVVFEGDALPWEVGVYEARCHIDNKYMVAASTSIFEIRVEPQPALDDLFLLPEPIDPTALKASQDKFTDDPGNQTLDGKATPPMSPESPILPPTHSNAFETVLSVILPLYKRALLRNDIMPTQHFVRDLHGEEKHARRIAYGIKLLYGVEFSWKVVMVLEPTIERMVERIQEARVILAPADVDAMPNRSATNTPQLGLSDVDESEADHSDSASASGRKKSMNQDSVRRYLRLVEKDKMRRMRNKKVPFINPISPESITSSK